MTDWGIPSLRSDRLATTIPTCVYAGDVVADPAHTLFMWRTASQSHARGCVIGFYVHDERFEALWRNPERYIGLFLRHGVVAVIEPDFSLWTDMPLAEQLYNIYRMRTVGCLWQEHGLYVIPNLAWSDERSFAFCFSGIPGGTPVVACECRTPGGNDEDRRRFLAGLTEGVKHARPQHVLIYGGHEHAFWLTGNLPQGPHYTLLESWTYARGKIRQHQERHAREINQPQLFSIGGARDGRTWSIREQWSETTRGQEQRQDQGREGQPHR